jgi:putative transcriptional regulator
VIVNRIGDVARERGLNILELAERAGVAYNTAHALYTGRATRVGFDVLNRICVALKAQPGDLLVRVDRAESTK